LVNISTNYQEMPLQLIFETVTSLEDLDRFTIASHLDRLYDAGVDSVYSKIAAAVRAYYKIISKAVHSDTTSMSVWGSYESDYQNDGGIDITKGYSKDGHPELNQYMVGNAVDENGISIYSKPLDGNTNDVIWNMMCLDAMESVLKKEDLVYVADSKVVSDDLVHRLVDSDIRFVSRLPKNFGNHLQEKALMSIDIDGLKHMEKRPEETKRTDRLYTEVDVEYDGMSLRLIPQVTSHNRGKGNKAVEKERNRFKEHIDSFVTVYSCLKDAQKAFDRLEKTVSKKYKMFKISATFKEFVAESRGRGRPRKDGADIIKEKLVRVNIEWEEIPEERESLWRTEEFIVMITNIPSVEKNPVKGASAEDVIRMYTGQYKVEGSFATFKKPAIADRLFLEKESRAEALISVFNMGVMLRGLMQHLLRRGIKDIDDENLPNYGIDRTPLQRNVTHAYFIQQFPFTNIHYFPKANEFTFTNKAADERASFYLSLMGIEPSSLLSRP